jgi:hypothetical protein
MIIRLVVLEMMILPAVPEMIALMLEQVMMWLIQVLVLIL